MANMRQLKTAPISPIESLACRERLLFSACGPIYAFLVCGKPKKQQGRRYKCKHCAFVSLVRLLSASKTMREARSACVLQLERTAMWLHYDSCFGMWQIAVTFFDHQTTAQATAHFAQEYARNLGQRVEDATERMHLALKCSACHKGLLRFKKTDLLRSLPTRPCTASSDGRCRWGILYGTKERLLDIL